MSLFKKFAAYCTRANERDAREDARRTELKLFNYEVEQKRKESRKCCSNCGWASGYCSMCAKHGYSEISDPDNMVCDDFYRKN